ncbi:hypothetical protein Pmani_020639 [Petrolisthes manimaculis]|uniref:Uncharacterized protein n=1 Tax=Petrolisthes manimaculis TaxID=1843537 RepID=A0AAE1U439_9EUCA|nr:hypothetical protein Pmani_020639 [Petrolisthes manimaculis]
MSVRLDISQAGYSSSWQDMEKRTCIPWLMGWVYGEKNEQLARGLRGAEAGIHTPRCPDEFTSCSLLAPPQLTLIPLTPFLASPFVPACLGGSTSFRPLWLFQLLWVTAAVSSVFWGWE